MKEATHLDDSIIPLTLVPSLSKAERIADYLGVDRALIEFNELDKNSALLYGKFDPINADDLGSYLQLIRRGDERFATSKFQRNSNAVLRCNNAERLIRILSRCTLSFRSKRGANRIFFYLINMRLSELGIAPYWRGMTSPRAYPKGADWLEADALYARDLQVFDMEWRHRHYPSQRVSSGYSGMYSKLMKGEFFDYEHAHIVAAAKFGAEQKAKSLMLTDDMQAEMMVLKSKKIAGQMRKLEGTIEKVETDLNMAASRNRSRGKKLRAVIPIWLKIWKSAAMTPKASLTVMVEQYKKVTGIVINRTTFNSKLKSINKALAEVGSKHVLDLVKI